MRQMSNKTVKVREFKETNDARTFITRAKSPKGPSQTPSVECWSRERDTEETRHRRREWMSEEVGEGVRECEIESAREEKKRRNRKKETEHT